MLQFASFAEVGWEVSQGLNVLGGPIAGVHAVAIHDLHGMISTERG